MKPKTFAAVARAIAAIENDGRLRSILRRAERPDDAFGIGESKSMMEAMREELHLHPGSTLPEECLILIAQRSVLDKAKRTHLGTLLGGSDEKTRRMSGLRFRRLMNARPGEDRLRQTRRALAMLDEVHPVSVVEAYLQLNDPLQARKFAHAYFGSLDFSVEKATNDPSMSDQGATQ